MRLFAWVGMVSFPLAADLRTPCNVCGFSD
jgi:hypothetical protein